MSAIAMFQQLTPISQLSTLFSVVLIESNAMPKEWPEGVEDFADFLRGKGLSFQRRGIVPHTGDKLWQYGTDKISVRVFADRGDCWSVQIADIAGWPQEWYGATELEELIRGRSQTGDNDVPQQMKFIEDDWLLIVTGFTAENRQQTHTRLKALREERARRMFNCR